ncbi:MAG: SH3 domain-containing protein [Oscillospiraceae bacterium]|nr:SH3 domain-containing protein [Oscillospiraceae bacterium]
MKVKVMQGYPSKWPFPGNFPTFAKGTPVSLVEEEDADFAGWYASEIAGHEPYTPIAFVRDGKLIRDYNPTELTQQAGDILEVREIVHAWLLATNEQGVTGWITAEAVVSVDS